MSALGNPLQMLIYSCSDVSCDYTHIPTHCQYGCHGNQAHTCKTLGIVTKPKSIASTHAQMRPRNIIHARAITFVLATTPSALGAGRGREYEARRY